MRIEDTDRARFVEGAVEYTHEALKWLGLKFDGEAVFQSDRLPIYQKTAEELIKEGQAYRCFCSSERLEELRTEQTAKKLPPGYDGLCRNLTEEEVKSRVEAGEKSVIRFSMPDTGSAKWTDAIRGDIEIEYKTQDDFVIIKSDGWPTYHLANVIDDHEMEINCVIRAEEWIPSTPKHIRLYEVLGWKHPLFAHMPITLGSDRQKLSKRHGDTAILDYKEKGFLPEAMVNFLVLLGWNPGTTEEIFSLSELEKIFSLDKINKAAAVFDLDRLLWINGMWIRRLSKEELLQRILDFDPSFGDKDQVLLSKIVEIEQTRLKTLGEFKEISDFYFDLPSHKKEILTFKKSTTEKTVQGLEQTKEALEQSDWKGSPEEFSTLLAQVVEKAQLGNADVFWPVRVALSGLDKSPSPAELLWALGKDESLARIAAAIQKIK